MKTRIVINIKDNNTRTYTPQVKKWLFWRTLGIFSERPSLKDAEDLLSLYLETH